MLCETSKSGIAVVFSRILHAILTRRYGIHINREVTLDIGIRIPHPTSIVITKCHIGKKFTIYQNCTIWQKSKTSGCFPIIGDNVVMYAGSSVIGDVNVTDNVVLGAHSCLLSDAKEPGTYIGTPAKLHKD